MPIKSMIRAVEEIRKRLNERRRLKDDRHIQRHFIDPSKRYGTINIGKDKTDGAPLGNHNAAGPHKQSGARSSGGFNDHYPGRKNIIPTGDLNILKDTSRKDGGPGSAPPKGNKNAAGPHKMKKGGSAKPEGGTGKQGYKSGTQESPKPYVPELKGRNPANGNPIYSEETWEHLSNGAVSFAGVSFQKKSLEEHILKHGPDGDRTYTKAECRLMNKRARKLLSQPVGGDIDGFARDNGMVVRYNRKTKEIATGLPGKKVHTIHKLNMEHEAEINGEKRMLSGDDYFDFLKKRQARKKSVAEEKQNGG